MSNASQMYGHLTNGGEVTINLTKEEACVLLKLYDYGALTLERKEGDAFNSILAKLKDQIWP